MIRRGMKIYFRDPIGVLTSMLTVIIIIVLYAVFLGNNLTKAIEADTAGIEKIDLFVKAWVLAGIITVMPVTLSMGIFSIKIDDDLTGTTKGLMVAPISRFKIVLSYLMTALIITISFTILAFIIGYFYLAQLGLKIVSWEVVVPILGVIVVNAFCSIAMMFFVISFIKSRTSYSSISAIVGTLVGFLAGIYLPIGQLPGIVQTVMKFFPMTYSAGLLRNNILDSSFKTIFADAPSSMVDSLKENLGVNLFIGNQLVTSRLAFFILISTGCLFLLLTVLRKKKSS
ncbi:ABC transporter permease [Carnobacterium maltaromaticum]|jgi:multidrug/hemolysin transport system permease protein|uniref:Transport permease protein n=1 Tax=Carnobacterium maltaromaticum LMA28 TaxID=1234679 RepID=K8EQ94_CARML|nr:ABC transporter permease [Carnobacterium maltaromaticum]AOA01631.1 ABC transporter permease [Carnobacterium maltaromaticum]MCI1817942.1 ABC transporter permease [Carnobacterium maltaromaticum]CCO10701.1 ABC-2 type transporter family protein [Carnobacterium maltaromaticum LMA28]